jgi:hypothetical protein
MIQLCSTIIITFTLYLWSATRISNWNNFCYVSTYHRFFTFYQKEFQTNHKVQVLPKNTSYISIKINRKRLRFLLWLILSVPLPNAVPRNITFPCAWIGGCQKWCGIEKNKIHKGLAQHWPVHINHTSSFVQPYVHVFSNTTIRTTCSFLLTEISSKSAGFIKCRPRCQNPNAAKA